MLYKSLTQTFSLRYCCALYGHTKVPHRTYKYSKDVYGYKESANCQVNVTVNQKAVLPSGVQKLIEAFQDHGHKVADLYPLKNVAFPLVQDLDPSFHGFNLDTTVSEGDSEVSVRELVEQLNKFYCGSMSLEASQVEDHVEKDWLHQHFTRLLKEESTDCTKLNMCQILTKSQVLDNFLAVKFPTLKRYGAEGAESMLVFIHYFMKNTSNLGAKELFVGMPHRGRNNLLLGELNFPPEVMLRKIKGMSEFPSDALSVATGDVLSHLFVSTDLQFDEGCKLHVNLLPNPSHLESINPVVMGKCRGRQQTLKEGDYSSGEASKRGDMATNLLIHGDAAFTGQGINMECFNLSQLPHFNTGGSVHLIVNNLVGFTTPPYHGRSTRHVSDLGKMIGCPVIHVSGDHPEQVAKAAQLAAEYRQIFRKDVIVDLLCYRRWGHNEMDDPTFTHPLTYKRVNNRSSVPDNYAEQLQNLGLVSADTIEGWKRNENEHLNAKLKACPSYEPEPTYFHADSLWAGMELPSTDRVTVWDTGCHADLLRYVGAKSVEVPDDFDLHGHLKKHHCDARLTKLRTNVPVDWALGETFAIGSLMLQGFDVRICGQDVGRGTFSHRHAFLVDQTNGAVHLPLNHMKEEQAGHLEMVNSLLSEEAVLGFEYGMSIEDPNRLTIWESQFGDFFNGAQIILDTFVTSGEAKWMYQSGLVILLPHGYDGAGPEHSSCRIERFLQCTNSSETSVDADSVNMSVCNPTTSSQCFHLLRRQMLRNYRKPLIVASPKILLRFPGAMSPMSDFTPGTHFRPVIGDEKAAQTVKKVILCSGKHFYALDRERNERGVTDTALLRVEELCPFPAGNLARELKKYPSATSFIWSQEEPMNMGPWSFVAPRFQNLLGVKLKYAGRPPLAAPAVGISEIHNSQFEALINDTFA